MRNDDTSKPTANFLKKNIIIKLLVSYFLNSLAELTKIRLRIKKIENNFFKKLVNFIKRITIIYLNEKFLINLL